MAAKIKPRTTLNVIQSQTTLSTNMEVLRTLIHMYCGKKACSKIALNCTDDPSVSPSIRLESDMLGKIHPRVWSRDAVTTAVIYLPAVRILPREGSGNGFVGSPRCFSHNVHFSLTWCCLTRYNLRPWQTLIVYREVHLLRQLGWVDLELGCSPILLGQ